jgi:hypothetical protein
LDLKNFTKADIDLLRDIHEDGLGLSVPKNAVISSVAKFMEALTFLTKTPDPDDENSEILGVSFCNWSPTLEQNWCMPISWTKKLARNSYKKLVWSYNPILNYSIDLQIIFEKKAHIYTLETQIWNGNALRQVDLDLSADLEDN